MLNHIVGNGILLVPQKRVVRAMNSAFSPFGWAQPRSLFKGNVFEEIIHNPVTIITEPLKQLDKQVIQPIYREVIQPVGHALEKIGQGIAKDPLTFIAQAAAVALAPVTGGMSLWALPVIAAASTAAKGGSLDQILTATAISAATAAVGGGFGLENSVGGLITSGMQTGGSIAAGTATFSIAGTSITASTASAIAAAGQGLAMGAVAATGAAVKGQDPFQAALPSLVGTALGFAGNQVAQADFFKPITSTLNDISANVSPIVSKAMTGVASAMITGAVTGKDMSQVALASLANTAVSGLVSASNVVADFFRNDQGGITNMGAATQSIVADLLGSVAATVASGGKMGKEMGAQFLANATNTLVPFLNPEFDALATNVQLTYKDAEAKVKAVNDAANAQQNWVNKYNADADKLNSLATEVNNLIARRDATYNAYNAATTQSEVDRLKAEFNSLESQIATKTNQYNALYDTIDDTNASYLQSVKNTEAAQKAYFEVSKTLGTLGTQLSSKMNEASKALTETAAKQIDPTFNAEQYKTINNLGPAVDAAVHYMSIGKDKGLPTNVEDARTYIDAEKQRLVGDIIKAQGYPSIMYVPKDVYEKTVKMVDTQYGNNLAQLKDATPTNITQWSTYSLGKTLGDYLPKYDAAKAQEAAYERMADIVITPSWYEGQAQKDYTLPTGMVYANQNDIMSGIAKAVTTKSGYTVWVKPTASALTVQQYDPATGEIKSKLASDILGTKTFDQMSAAEKMAFLNSIEKATLSTENRAKLVEQAGASAIDDAKKVISTIQSANISDDAKNIVSSIVAGVGNVPGMFGTALKYIGYYTDIESIENKGAELTKWSDSFSDLVKASRSADAKASAENIQLINNSTKGFLDSVSGWAQIIKTEGKEVLSGMLAEEFGEEAAQKGGSLAAMAATWASAAAMGIELGAKKIIGVGVAVDAATSMLESFDGTAKSTEKRLYDAYIAQGMSRELAASKAKDDSLAPALFSALVTGAAEGVAGKTLVDAVFGKTLDDAAMSMAKRFMSAEAVNVLADLSEGGLQGLAEELAVWKVDPKAADIAGGATKGALWEATLGRGMGTTVAGTGLLINLAYAANPAFEAALKSGNYTMGELGAVLNAWTPPVSQTQTGSADIRTALLPQIFEAVPQYAASYSSAGDFINAVKSATGVWDATVIANVAEKVNNGKFASQVTTAQEAVRALEAQGLTGVTVEDALKAGIVGVDPSFVKPIADSTKVLGSEGQTIKAAPGTVIAYGANGNYVYKTVDSSGQITLNNATFGDPAYGIAKKGFAVVDQNAAAVANYANANMVSQAEVIAAAKQEGYAPSAQNAATVANSKALDQLYNTLLKRAPDAAGKEFWMGVLAKSDNFRALITNFAESGESIQKNGRLTTAKVNSLLTTLNTTRATALYDQLLGRAPDAAGLKGYVAALNSGANVANIAQEFSNSTEYIDRFKDDINALVGRGVEADVIANFIKQIDPKAVTIEEATQYFKDLGYTKATSTDIAQFVKSAPESEITKAIAAWVDPRQVTRAEAIQFFAQLGYTPTEAEIAQYVVQGPEVVQDTIKKNLEAYVDPRYVDASEVQAAFKDLGLDIPLSAADIKRYTGQYAESELSGKAKAGLPVVASNAMYAAFTGGTGGVNQTQIDKMQTEIAAKIDAFAQLGLSRDEAQTAAINSVAAQLGTTKADLISKLGTTEAALKSQIGAVSDKITTVQTAIMNQMAANQKAGMQSDAALQSAIDSVATNLGTTKADLLESMGTTEANLTTKIDTLSQQLTTKISSTETAILAKMKEYQDNGVIRDEAQDRAIADVAKELGVTKSELATKIGTTEANLASKLNATQATLNTKIDSVQTNVLAKMAEYQKEGLAADAALQKAITTVSTDLGTTKTELLAEIGQTEKDLTNTINAKVSASQKPILDQVAQYESAGLARDQAIQKAVDSVATNLGTTKTDLINRIGATETNLASKIATLQAENKANINTLSTKITAVQNSVMEKMATYEAAGISRDAALSKAISSVASDLGTTKQALLDDIGQTEAYLSNKITTVQQQLNTKISTTETSILSKMAAYEAQGLARDVAQNKAISDVATQLGLSTGQLAAKIGTTEANLTSKINASQAALNTKIDTVQTNVLSKMAQYQSEGLAADAALKKSIDAVATNLGTTKTALLAEIGQTEADLTNTINTKVAATERALLDKMAVYEAQDLSRDQALQKAVSSVATQLGTTTSSLLSRIGTTESTLSSKIASLQDQEQKNYTAIQQQMAANQAAGMASDVALKKSITDVATKLGVTEANLMASIGKTTSQLQTSIDALSGKVDASQKAILDQVAKYESAGLSRDQAIQKSVDSVASQLGTTRTDLMNKIGATEQTLTGLVESTAAASRQYTQEQIQQATTLLQNQIASNQAAGMDAIAATNKAVNDVANKLGIAATELQSAITESSKAGMAYTQQQVQQATNILKNQIDAYQKSGMDANAATNKAVQDLSDQLGLSSSTLLAQMGTNQQQLIDRIVASQKESQQFTKDEISAATQQLQDQMAAYEKAGADRDTATQLAISSLAQDLGIAKSDLLAKLGTTEANLTQLIQQTAEATNQYTYQQISSATAEIQKQMQANLQAGMESDAALQKAIDDVATQSNVNTQTLLDKIGMTTDQLRTEFSSGLASLESQIKNQLAAYEQAGIDRDTALDLAIASVAQDLGTTKADLLAQMGTNQNQLLAKIEETSQAGMAYTQQQVAAATAAIQQQMQANMQAGMAADAALQKAISDVAAQSNTNTENLLSQIGKTEATLRAEFTTGLSDVQKQIQDQMAAYEKAGYDRDTALSLAISGVAQDLGTTKANLLSKLGTTEANLAAQIAASQQASQQYTQQQVQQSQQAIMDKMAAYEAAGMSRDAALQQAINDVSAQLGTTSANLLQQMGTNQQQLLAQIGQTQTQLQSDLAKVKQDIQTQMAAYEQAGIDRDTALSLAITGVSQQLGTTRSDLLSQLGTTEANLKTEFTAQISGVSQQVQDVAKLLGKPASQVTSADITNVQNMIAGTSAVNMGYDVNQDGKVDTQDLTLIQQQQQIQQGTNVTETIDPNTGLSVYTDKTTGQVITGFTPAGGSPWASTGIYSVLDQQKAQQAATAKAQAAKAKQATQKNQFGQLMSLLFQSPDAQGQSVTVKTPDPSKINYIYDWSSIFATPSQASMMPSPYGPMNTVMPQQPQQKQQAANQPLFQLASGFAGGGIVGGNDIEVGGGGSVDDLINILKGNG